MGKFRHINTFLPALACLQASLTYAWGGPGGNYHNTWEQQPAPIVTSSVWQVEYTTVYAPGDTQPPAQYTSPVYTPPVYTTPVYTPPAYTSPVYSPPPPASSNPVYGASSVQGGSPTSAASAGVPSGSTTPNSCGSNAQKISVDNKSGNTLIVQAGPPWTVGDCGTISSGSTCTFCQTRGSTGGNLQFGYGTANSRGTWIEGNWDTDAQWATVDVSFIPGYSVPISCTSDLTGATNGWSSPLCTDSSCSNCNSGGGSWDGNACENPAGDASNPIPNGPCPSFFSSSQGGAYCYPNDNGVVGYGEPWSSVSCTAYAQSGSSSGKRDANETFFPRDAEEKKSVLQGRDDNIARRHADAARRGAHGGARVHARSLKNLVA